MSTNLQQVVAKSKVSTLDGDLKDIAEEMLREKFGFEEEVLAKPQDTFLDPDRGRSSKANAGCGNSFCASCYGGIDPCRFEMGRGPGYDPRFMDSPAYGIRTTRITLESCYEIFRQLERDVGPSIRRRNAEWRMGRRQFDDLIRDRRSESAVRFGGTPQLFGIPVLLSGMDTHEIELRCF